MENLEKKEQFIELRAKGKSFTKISEEIGISKTTLIDWSKDLTESISNLRSIELEAIGEKLKIGKEHRIQIYLDQLEAVKKELGERGYKDLSIEKLLALQFDLIELLKNEDRRPSFSRTKRGMPFDDLTYTERWSA